MWYAKQWTMPQPFTKTTTYFHNNGWRFIRRMLIIILNVQRSIKHPSVRERHCKYQYMVANKVKNDQSTHKVASSPCVWKTTQVIIITWTIHFINPQMVQDAVDILLVCTTFDDMKAYTKISHKNIYINTVGDCSYHHFTQHQLVNHLWYNGKFRRKYTRFDKHDITTYWWNKAKLWWSTGNQWSSTKRMWYKRMYCNACNTIGN